jgi:rod shape-determining protein MreD
MMFLLPSGERIKVRGKSNIKKSGFLQVIGFHLLVNILCNQNGEEPKMLRTFTMFWGSAVFSRVLYAIFVIFILVAFQSFFADAVSIKGMRLDLAILVLVYVGLTKGSTQGVVFGFLIGLLLDVFTPEKLGLGALIKSLVGFAVGSFKDKLFLESSYSKGAIVFLCVLLNDFLYHLLSEGVTIFTFHTILYYSLPSSLYTCGVGILLFVILEKKFSYKMNSSG